MHFHGRGFFFVSFWGEEGLLLHCLFTELYDTQIHTLAVLGNSPTYRLDIIIFMLVPNNDVPFAHPFRAPDSQCCASAALFLCFCVFISRHGLAAGLLAAVLVPDKLLNVLVVIGPPGRDIWRDGRRVAAGVVGVAGAGLAEELADGGDVLGHFVFTFC